MFKKTKIICTLGPTTDSKKTLTGLLKSGMNCARFNFSHGTHEEHKKRIEAVKKISEEYKKPIALLLDTKGPEIRLGSFQNGSVQLLKDKFFTLKNEDLLGDEEKASITYKELYREVKKDDIILLSDGLVSLKVVDIIGKDIKTIILNSGKMSDKKRVAVPKIAINLPPISPQDEKDIIFGIKEDMDFVAASFTQRASDIKALRQLIKEHNGHMEIIAKIENLEGVNNIDEIIEEADGIMVARGDLGVEIPVEDVPLIQKEIVEKCNQKGKLVIIATQMLESMTTNPRPTRAEASDVANAILDGTDAIMLSGETANGEYPIEAVKTMNKIAMRIESSLKYKKLFISRGFTKQPTRTDAIAHATVQMAYELDASAIITPTESGYTTRIVSKYRPKATIVAYTSKEHVARHLSLRWGVELISGKPWKDIEHMIIAATEGTLKNNYAKKGDTTILTSGLKTGEGNTSTIRVHTL